MYHRKEEEEEEEGGLSVVFFLAVRAKLTCDVTEH
jgi:hypothetical protein